MIDVAKGLHSVTPCASCSYRTNDLGSLSGKLNWQQLKFCFRRSKTGLCWVKLF